MVQERSNSGRNVLIALGVGLGSFGGSYLAELLSRKPSPEAPDTEKLNFIIELIQERIRQDGLILDSLGNILDRLDIISDKLVPSEGGVLPSSILTPWVAGEPDQIFDQAIRNAGTFFTTKRVDFRNGKRLVLRAENTLDQPVALQVTGHFQDMETGATDIGAPVACVAGGNTSIGLAWDDWHPYIAARMTIGIAPTIGFLRIWYDMQE